jgi:hypothetical protein
MKFYVFWRLKPEIIQASDRLALPYPLSDLEEFRDLNETLKFVYDLKINKDVDKLILIPIIENEIDLVIPEMNQIIIKQPEEIDTKNIHIIKEIKI